MENKELEKTNWVDEMIQREALPFAARVDTIKSFCEKWKIKEARYSYQSSKTDNWQKILKIILRLAKKECPEILKVLVEKAKAGDTKAIDMYLDYIIKLAKNLDVQTGGEKIANIDLFNYVEWLQNKNNNWNGEDNKDEQTDQGSARGNIS